MVAAVVSCDCHIVSTTTYDVLLSTLLVWLVTRTVRTGDGTLLLPAGLVLGIGLLNKDLIGIYAVCLFAAVLLVGPRSLLRHGWLAGGAGCRTWCGRG